MFWVVVAIFIVGYAGIVFEHRLKLDKTATALLMACLSWAALVSLPPIGEASADWPGHVAQKLAHHFEDAAQILFFLLGAMAIVEMMDAHDAFRLITTRITTRKAVPLLWMLATMAFAFSAVLDNLTTAIVMASLLRKLVANQKTRWIFAGVVVIAANAGGAFSPLGDVTTTMLWIGGQISSSAILSHVFVPSLVCFVIPVLLLARGLPKELGPAPQQKESYHRRPTAAREERVMLLVGLASILFVPIFKMLTGLPPFMGMLFSLSLVWIASQLLHRRKPGQEREQFSAAAALSRTDSSSILFFLGILLAVGALDTLHLLEQLAGAMVVAVGDINLIAYVFGLASAVIDNVPLVAASQGMFSLETYPQDHPLWMLLAYTTGTGGSILIIGSAAGVAVMGIENIPFRWYLRKIGLPAFLGYTAGMVVLVLQYL
jgi:Na+/H+ antiporter NhaD/arsenite permease-like protein